ncbi:MAG: hypothetical protein ABEJ23_08830 [Haloarculaceae archaeon]
MNDDDPDLDRLLQAVSDRLRRRALSCLGQHEVLTLADLADELAEREYGAPLSEVPPEAVKEIYLTLYHTHVPRLEAEGLVRYDQEQDMVGITDRGRVVEGWLDETLDDLRR